MKITESTIILTTVLLYCSKFVSTIPFREQNSNNKAQSDNNEKNSDGPVVAEISDLINGLYFIKFQFFI